MRHNCNTIKKFLTSLFSFATVQSPSTNRYSKVKIILDENDIKAILTDFIKENYGPLMTLDEFKTYTYAPTATFVHEGQDVSAQ